jgi:ABC-2 type transport system ATP-binding protein
MGAAAIEVLDVAKSYEGRQVLCGLSFSVPPSQTLALLAPNGAGKTTTVEMRLF